MLVLDWRRRLYFIKKLCHFYSPGGRPGRHDHLRAGHLHLPKTKGGRGLVTNGEATGGWTVFPRLVVTNPLREADSS